MYDHTKYLPGTHAQRPGQADRKRRTRPSIKTKCTGNTGTSGAHKTRAYNSPPPPPQPTTMLNTPYEEGSARGGARRRAGRSEGGCGGGCGAGGQLDAGALGGGHLGALSVDQRHGGGPLPQQPRRPLRKAAPSSPRSISSAPAPRRGRDHRQISPATGADGYEGSGNDM